MADSVELSRANVFPFLSLPLELRWMIYIYALCTPFGLWMDNYRRDIPGIMRKLKCRPGRNDILAVEEGLFGIVSPSLLLVCRQIYLEAKEYLAQNQWRLSRWSTDAIAEIPQEVRSKVTSLFLGRDPAGLFAPAGTARQNLSFWNLTFRLPNIQHLTIGMLDDDMGLRGKPYPGVMVTKEEADRRAAPLTILTSYKGLFRMGHFKSLSLECRKTYPSALYQWVYMWSWVMTMAFHVLPLERDEEMFMGLMNSVKRVNSLLGSHRPWYMPSYRNYAPLLDNGHKSAPEFETIMHFLRGAWGKFGFRVTARDPHSFERGTMIVIERVSAEESAGFRMPEV